MFCIFFNEIRLSDLWKGFFCLYLCYNVVFCDYFYVEYNWVFYFKIFLYYELKVKINYDGNGNVCK